MGIARDRIIDPDLTTLRDLPRGEAIRIAMLRYGWDAATAVEKVYSEQGRYVEEFPDQRPSEGPVSREPRSATGASQTH